MENFDLIGVELHNLEVEMVERAKVITTYEAEISSQMSDPIDERDFIEFEREEVQDVVQ